MKKIIFLTILTVFISACGQAHIFDEQAASVEHQKRYQSANVECDKVEYSDYLEERIRERLQKRQIPLGNDLLIRCKMDYEKGNQALRYFVGFGAGKGYTDIDVEIYNSQGEKITQFNVKAELVMGGFGGKSSEMLNNAARTIVQKVEPLIAK
ncbi:MAG: DUF4410 domain-containing protein [Cardiobacteriaceae bacterium]|nr:DUF4410 domain-containing protein [Cardiobacteriaceae bacterium]